MRTDKPFLAVGQSLNDSCLIDASMCCSDGKSCREPNRTSNCQILKSTFISFHIILKKLIEKKSH